MTGEDADQARTYPAGVTCWVDTHQPDVDAAADFYGRLLGWAFADAMPADAQGRYLVATLQGKEVAAIGSGADRAAAWHTYVAVEDADASVAALRDTVAVVLEQPVDVGPAGRTATVRDPEGAELRLWQAGRRPGAQLTNVPGAWNFSDLRTSDAAQAQSFYGAWLGWVFVDLGFGTAIQVPGYGDHLEATIDPHIRTRQAKAPPGFADVIGALSPLSPAESAHWHVTFTVANRDDTASVAEASGATVLDSGGTDWTRTATIRDPQGAVFTASQFAPPSGF
jgi:uncharacterized protein